MMRTSANALWRRIQPTSCKQIIARRLCCHYTPCMLTVSILPAAASNAQGGGEQPVIEVKRQATVFSLPGHRFFRLADDTVLKTHVVWELKRTSRAPYDGGIRYVTWDENWEQL